MLLSHLLYSSNACAGGSQNTCRPLISTAKPAPNPARKSSAAVASVRSRSIVPVGLGWRSRVPAVVRHRGGTGTMATTRRRKFVSLVRRRRRRRRMLAAPWFSVSGSALLSESRKIIVYLPLWRADAPPTMRTRIMLGQPHLDAAVVEPVCTW